MPTIKTIKPDGTGDYTLLATWQTFAAAQATADQWAECYSGGNLGSVFINASAWVSISTALLYPRVYAAATSRHNGKIEGASGTNGAYILGATNPASLRSSVAYTRVDGLIINKDAATGFIVALTGANHRFENNIVRRNAGTASSLLESSATPTTQNVVANNLFYLDPAVTAAGVVAIAVSDGDGSGGPGYFVNNTVLNNTRAGTGVGVNYVHPTSSRFWNNFLCGFDAVGGQFSVEDSSFPDSTVDYDYNACDDGALPSSDFHQQVTDGAITLYVVSATDPTPVSGSLLIDNGTSSVSLGIDAFDAIGTARPQGAAYDIGAVEYVVSAVDTRRRRCGGELRI